MQMTRRRSIVAFATVLLIATAFVRAQEGGLKLAEVSPGELHFALMPNGTYQANVVGDITKPGPYAVRTKLPAGLRLPPHFHPEPRIVLIVSGTLYVGYGDRFDETKMVALPAGSVFTEPSKQSHFTWAKDGEVVLHVTGQGPSATTWLDQK